MAELTGKFRGGGARKRTAVRPYEPGQVSVTGTRLNVQMGSPSAWSASYAGDKALADAVFGVAKTFGTIMQHQNDVEDKLSLSRAQMEYSTRLTRESLALQQQGLDGQEYVDAAAEMMKYARIDATGNAKFNSNATKKEWEIIANQADTTFMISSMKFGTQAKSQRLRAETLEQLDNSAKYATALPDHDTAMELYGQIQQRIDESVDSLQLSDDEGMKLKNHYGREIDYHFAKEHMRHNSTSFRELLSSETAFYGKYNYLNSDDLLKLKEEDNEWKWKEETRTHQRLTWQRQKTFNDLTSSILGTKPAQREPGFGDEPSTQSTAAQLAEDTLTSIIQSPDATFERKERAIMKYPGLGGGQKTTLLNLLRTEKAVGDKEVAEEYELDIASGELTWGLGYERGLPGQTDFDEDSPGKRLILDDPHLSNKQKTVLLKKMKKIPMDDPDYKAASDYIRAAGAGVSSRTFSFMLPPNKKKPLAQALSALYKQSVLGKTPPMDAATKIVEQYFKPEVASPVSPSAPTKSLREIAAERVKKQKEAARRKKE